ncbi:hypothetical protein [Paracoccus sp. (in: a-proteobacteria)]|uniref:hypothetical protein n=1 Tax=Paracoccus sp. TaxID=267 RepID=UPI003A8ABAE3
MLFSRLPVVAAILLFVAFPAHADKDDLKNIQIQSFYVPSDRAALEQTIQTDNSARDVAIAWHGLAGMQVDGASRSAVAKLSELPDLKADPMLQAYLGSAYIMKARDQSFIPARVRSVRQGLKWLEGSIIAQPDNFDIRAMRAATTMNLPDIFGYRETTRGDLQVLITKVESGDAPFKRGSLQEGRMIAALGKLCAEQQDLTCAEAQIQTLQANYADNAEMTDLAARLSAAIAR